MKRFPRLWHLHARLLLSSGFGATVALTLIALPWRFSTRIIVGWDAGVALYLALVCLVMARGSIAEIRRRAAVNDEGAIALLVLTAAAALASLVAVLAELGHSPGPYQIALSIATILLSWTFMHTMFALHYLHEFYGQGADDQLGGLVFPGSEDPDYWDFLYYSLVVANDRAGVRCPDYQQDNPSADDAARCNLIFFQCNGARADRQHRIQSDAAGSVIWL